MQKLLTVNRSGSSLVSTSEVDEYLAKGWVIVSMVPFHPSHAVCSAGGGYGTGKKIRDYGTMLVVIEDMGIEDPVEDPIEDSI